MGYSIIYYLSVLNLVEILKEFDNLDKYNIMEIKNYRKK